jgi:type IV secretory pathway VirB10-like protein
MEISKTTVGIVAAACITAGAAGAYVAVRPATVRPATTDASSDTSSTAGVEQSEAVIADAPAAPVVEAPAPPPQVQASAARSSAPARSPAATTARAESARPAAATAPVERPRPAPSVAAPARVTEDPAPPAPEPIQPIAPAPVLAAEPPAPRFEDLVVSADSVLGLQMETSLTSERARVEDEVVARVTRDVRVGDRVAIPAGSKAHGEVTLVERGGKVRDRARLGIRFTSVVLADGTRVPVETDTIYREGDGPGGESAAKIGGGAIGGAILGGIFGGAKGAVIGGTAGAGAGTAAVMAGGRNPATLPSGTPVTVRLVKPATVTVEQE